MFQLILEVITSIQVQLTDVALLKVMHIDNAFIKNQVLSVKSCAPRTYHVKDMPNTILKDAK